MKYDYWICQKQLCHGYLLAGREIKLREIVTGKIIRKALRSSVALCPNVRRKSKLEMCACIKRPRISLRLSRENSRGRSNSIAEEARIIPSSIKIQLGNSIRSLSNSSLEHAGSEYASNGNYDGDEGFSIASDRKRNKKERSSLGYTLARLAL